MFQAGQYFKIIKLSFTLFFFTVKSIIDTNSTFHPIFFSNSKLKRKLQVIPNILQLFIKLFYFTIIDRKLIEDKNLSFIQLILQFGIYNIGWWYPLINWTQFIRGFNFSTGEIEFKIIVISRIISLERNITLVNFFYVIHDKMDGRHDAITND